MSPELSANVEAFARLFEAVHEGVYIGTIQGPDTRTAAANPHLKLMFGYAADTPDGDVRPFEADRFLDPQARDGLIATASASASRTRRATCTTSSCRRRSSPRWARPSPAWRTN